MLAVLGDRMPDRNGLREQVEILSSDELDVEFSMGVGGTIAAVCSRCQSRRNYEFAMDTMTLDVTTMTENMHFRLLTAIAERSESLAAFQMLKDSLQKDAKVFPDHYIGWQGGRRQHTVYWLSKLSIWAVLEQSPPLFRKGPRRRFWNCFGIHNPENQQTLKMSVEINPPHEGENRRVGGLFARDDENRIYIAHTGKVGGGRKGIGLREFRKYSANWPWQVIETQGGKQTAVVIGPIDAPDFPNQLSDFVHNVACFKKRADKNSATG
jgi:hypothetical protein